MRSTSNKDRVNNIGHSTQYLLWTSICREDSNIYWYDGNDDTEKSYWREFTDKFDTQEHPDKHNYQQDSSV